MPNPQILPIPPETAAAVNAAVRAAHRQRPRPGLVTATVSYEQAHIIWLSYDPQVPAPAELHAQIAAANALLFAWQRESQAAWQDPDPAQEPPRCWPINRQCSRMACGRSAIENGYTLNPNFVTCPACRPKIHAGEPGYIDHRSRWAVAAGRELARALSAAPQENRQAPAALPQSQPQPLRPAA